MKPAIKTFAVFLVVALVASEALAVYGTRRRTHRRTRRRTAVVVGSTSYAAGAAAASASTAAAQQQAAAAQAEAAAAEQQAAAAEAEAAAARKEAEAILRSLECVFEYYASGKDKRKFDDLGPTELAVVEKIIESVEAKDETLK